MRLNYGEHNKFKFLVMKWGEEEEEEKLEQRN